MSTSSSANTATDCKASAAASAAKPANTADGTSKAKKRSADKLPALKDCEQKITELRKLRHSYALRMARNLRVKS